MPNTIARVHNQPKVGRKTDILTYVLSLDEGMTEREYPV